MALVNHTTRALGRLILQYKDATVIQAIISAFGTQLNELEQANEDLLTLRSIFTATGAQLDIWGVILDLDRAGRTDDEYRTRLFIKIAEYYSEGTISDVVQLYTNLMVPTWVKLTEQYPANFMMHAKDPNPIGSTSEIRDAIQAAKAAGVGFDLTFSTSPAFAFLADPDPDTDGFSSVAAPTTGGIFASVL
jgi:hypothetical protein